MAGSYDRIELLRSGLESVIKGKREAIELALTALCASGNILIEDVPGVGKTTLAKALAKSIEGVFNRIQFTPDLLPSDILGSSVYNPRDGRFSFREGPVFANILLADEINRASPRTQSALLEAMSEGQATIEGVTHHLPHPFLVMATENPIEYHGTYPLPEAQLDRFSMRITLGYPGESDELDMLYSRKERDPLTLIKPVLNCAEISAIQEEVRRIELERSVASYALRVVRATRGEQRIRLGASPRSLVALCRCAQARAFLNGRGYVLPDDVKQLSGVVLAHRIVLDNKARQSGLSPVALLEELLTSIPVPV